VLPPLSLSLSLSFSLSLSLASRSASSIPLSRLLGFFVQKEENKNNRGKKSEGKSAQLTGRLISGTVKFRIACQRFLQRIGAIGHQVFIVSKNCGFTPGTGNRAVPAD